MKMFRKDEGFTLVELMVVVLIIGILVAIAVPVFLNAAANAEAKSCQANQRTIVGAISTFGATTGSPLVIVAPGAVLTNQLTGQIKTPPVCPTRAGGYFISDALDVVADNGADPALPADGWATPAHKLP